MKKYLKVVLASMIGVLIVAAVPLNTNPTIANTCSNDNISFSEKREIKKEFQVKSGGKVVIDLKTGAKIEVYGWDKETLSAVAYIKDNEDNRVDFEFTQNGNDVEITSEYAERHNRNSSNAKLVLQVPFKYNVEFSTMGGDVKAQYVEGNFSGKTMGGELDFSHMKGYLDVTTMGGKVKVKDSEVDGKAHTMGGEVLLENIKGDLNASSMGGAVRQINVQGKNKSIGKEVNISTMGGEIEVDKAPNGAKLKTMGGEITVNQVGEFADVETMGGSIAIKEIDGWVKAKTMGGDIDVKMTGNPAEGKRNVTLTSMGGDVTLTVPAELSMDIEIEIAYTKDSDKDYEDCKVASDFSVKEERSNEWDRSKGSPRKYITATGSTGDGKNKIKIKTINGNVFLKKA
jgi:hypothetical protein